MWYSSPANRHRYFKAFKDQYLETGKADFSAFMKTHPETISETFGDEATSEGQMVKALVQPSATIMAIGGLKQGLEAMPRSLGHVNIYKPRC